MEGGPHHGRIVEYGSAELHPPLIWQFAVIPEIPICALAADGIPFTPMEADGYQRAVPAKGDPDLWFYDYLGRR